MITALGVLNEDEIIALTDLVSACEQEMAGEHCRDEPDDEPVSTLGQARA